MKDVLFPEDHRSIRSIPVPPNRRRMGDMPDSSRRQPPPQDDFLQEPRKRRGSRFVWVAAIMVLAVLAAVGGSIIFKKASVTVVPKQEKVTLPSSLTAYADASVGELQFQTVTTTNVGNRTVAASGESQVQKRATGTITIYNEYSTATQRLIKNTRFEAPDGKIYRVDQSVEIPGGTKKTDGKLTAGTLDVVVSADSAGEAYNRGLDTYTIPGFKGDPRYTKFYAKGKTPMTGGFVGLQKIVADADLSAAKTAIQTELAASLQAALASATPEGYLLVPQSTAIIYEELPQGGDANAAVISLRGSAKAAIVREGDLAAAVAKASNVSGYMGEALRFSNAKDLNMSAKATVTPKVTTLPLSFSGEASLVWQIDGTAIQTALVGAPVGNLLSILTQFKPAVSDAKASLRPFWQSSFPKDSKLIEVTVKDPS